MGKYFIFAFILLAALFLQTAFFSLPCVLLILILLTILIKELWLFPVAFGMGLLLDIMLFHTVGISSIFFVIILGIIFLYDRKFEVQSIPFVIVFSFVAALCFGFIFQTGNGFLSALISSLFSGGIFWTIALISKGEKKNYKLLHFR